MSAEFQQSLVQRTGMALAAVILLAVVNMVASYLTAESSENDAVRINLAGSLRMQAYRIANEHILRQSGSKLGDADSLAKSVGDFENRLRQPVLAMHIRNTDNQVLNNALHLVEEGWMALKPDLVAGTTPPEQLLEKIDGFVADIDDMVKILEMQTESKFRVLRFIQGASLLLTVCLASIMFLNVYRYVVGPLRQLVDMAGRLRAADFSMRLDSKNDDELALLASTFNDMADSLDGMYRTLEDQVRSKTRHLEDTQKMLRFLYDTSRRLSEQGNIVSKLERTMDHLQREIKLSAVDIRLQQSLQEQPFLISSRAGTVSGSDGERDLAGRDTALSTIYPLQNDNRNYGSLTIVQSAAEGVSNEQNLMLTSLADTIAAALANEARKDQAHRVALMEERTAIARELHDSIAQSLSFTRIQASRLQSLLAKGAAAGELDSVLVEIRAGIQSAYAQLRELLTTFRLQIDSPGLQASLLATAREFEAKGDLAIELKSTVQNYPLTPNEEIHILQIVREALSNVVRHSGADRAAILLAVDAEQSMIEVRIRDNGQGLVTPEPGHSHYGLTIMRERAEILGGIIEFSSPAGGGVEVLLRFTPEHAISPIDDTKTAGHGAGAVS
jgi:two-component system nitrate/nitrite sensor histidine kinase NarX